MARLSSVLVLSQFYWPEPIGSGPPIAKTARILAGRSGNVSVFTSRPHYPHGRVFDGYVDGEHDRQAHEGVTIERLWTVPAKGGGLLARARSEAAFFLALLWRGLTGRLPNADAVITVCPSTLTVLAGGLLALGRRRHVCIVHDIQSGLADGLKISGAGAITGMIRAIERFAFNRADALIVLNEGMGRELRKLGVKRPISIIPPLFDIGSVTPVPLPEGAAVRLLYSGNLGKKQGLEQVLDAAELLQEHRPDIEILIRGEGSQREALEQHAGRLGLRNVRFAGFVPEEELSKELGAHAIHLVPQVPEGAQFAVPSKIFMIMAAARPAICTAGPDTPLYQIMEQTGAIACVPPNDPAALCDRILALVDEPDEAARMGLRGRDYVEQEFAPENYGARLEAILHASPERQSAVPRPVALHEAQPETRRES